MVSFFRICFVLFLSALLTKWFKYRMHVSLFHNTVKDNKRFGEICTDNICHKATGYLAYVLWQESHHSFSLLGVLRAKVFLILFYALLLIKISFISYSSVMR